MKNIDIVDENGKPFSRTYPRRADNLVKYGRARRVDESTIQMTPSAPSQETEDNHMQNTHEWVEYFKNLTERIIANDELTTKAIEACSKMQGVAGSPDCPSRQLSTMLEKNLQFKENICRNLMEFISQNFAKTIEFIENSQVDPMIKNEQLIRLVSLRTIGNLDTPPEQKLKILRDIAQNNICPNVQNLENQSLKHLVVTNKQSTPDMAEE